MRLERLELGEVQRLGVDAAARRLRALVPGAATVQEDVREIVEAVRSGGDAAVARYTAMFDSDGAEPASLRVSPEELDAAIVAMPRELIAGLQVAIANVALVAEAGVGHDVAVD